MSSCPGDGVLRMLGTDAIGDMTYAAIEQHVEGCPDCKSDLERLAHRRPDPAIVSPAPERLPGIPGFEIQSELGRGAMGVVYLAIETGLDRLVALKVLPGSMGADGGAGPRRRWLREARAISSVRHPNVVPLYDFGEADGSFFLVLEFVPGGTLKQRLTDPLPPRVAAGLMETIARAVGHVHSRGLFHLDLKPSNILLDGEENELWDRVTPRIADFGLALSNDEAGASEKSLAGIRGTPSYMAPEQASGSRAKVGAATDIHALGAILYELLTGRPPFRGSSTLETHEQVRVQEPVPLRRLNPKLPRDLETIALKCLEKNPSRRYASAEAFAGDLRRWLDDRPISARPVSVFARSWSWSRRHAAITALAGTLLLTFLVSFLTIVLLWRRAEAERNHAKLEQTHSEQGWRYAELERSRADRERLRAEDDYQVARTALTNFVEVVMLGLKDVSLRDHLILRLESVRERMVDLAKARPNARSIYRDLALVCLLLGKDHERRRDWAKCLPLYFESMFYWEKVLHEDPHDVYLQKHRWETSMLLARAVEEQGNADESVRLWERAVSLGESLLPLENEGETAHLVDSRIALAKVLHRTGNPDRAMTILEANLGMIGELAAVKITPNVAGQLRWIHRELGALMERFSPAEFDRLTANEWAQRFAALLCSSPQNDIASVNEELWTAYRLIAVHEQKAASHRRNDKLDEACRIVDRIHAFALLVVARYPNQPVAHLILDRAYQQRAKNYWRLNDRGAVERNWKLALEEARRTLSFEPANDRARRDVTELQRRLNDLLNPRPGPVGVDRPVGSALERKPGRT